MESQMDRPGFGFWFICTCIIGFSIHLFCYLLAWMMSFGRLYGFCFFCSLCIVRAVIIGSNWRLAQVSSRGVIMGRDRWYAFELKRNCWPSRSLWNAILEICMSCSVFFVLYDYIMQTIPLFCYVELQSVLFLLEF